MYHHMALVIDVEIALAPMFYGIDFPGQGGAPFRVHENFL